MAFRHDQRAGTCISTTPYGWDGMAKLLGKLWRWITYHRHRSELWALGLAMKEPVLAIFPILTTVGFWWGLIALFVILPTMLLLEVLGRTGRLILAVLGIPALVALLAVVATWFFRWYFIAAGLMFGRRAMAQVKEKALLETIQAYRTSAG